MGVLVFDYIGLVHLLSSVLALIFGSIVLFSLKGTQRHKRLGYIYAVNMFIVLVTALMIYRLSGGVNIFHFIAMVGFFYLAIGILPVVFRTKNWISKHVYFMYWSVIGLYAAFVAEVMVRIPSTPFWWMVGLGAGIVSFAGGYYYGKKKRIWVKINPSQAISGQVE